MGKFTITRKKLRAMMKSSKKRMPFEASGAPTPRPPRSMRDRQRSWILARLKHLKAPVVPCHTASTNLSIFILYGSMRQKQTLQTGKTFSRPLNLSDTQRFCFSHNPQLDWSQPCDHVETFAGRAEVTRAELEVGKIN